MARGTARRTIRVPDELWLAAQNRADERRESLSEVIRNALERYVDDPDQGPPDKPQRSQ